jgi:glycosyltransferase involved in cell wall biosynthesis
LSNFIPFFYLIGQIFRKKADVVIVYNTSLSWTLPFLLVKWLTGKELIIILPEFYKKPEKILSAKGLKWINFYAGLKFLSKYADKLITLTTFMKNFMLKQGFEESKILILPNVTDSSYFKAQVKTTFKEEKTTIGYCGTPNYKDGIDDLIKSFGALCKLRNDVHLLIIGDAAFGKSLVPQLKLKVEELNIANQVTFTGLVTGKEVAGYLNACQILALTRPAGIFAEAGFPTKLGEYFACEKPVLVTAVGDIPYYFKNREHALIVQPGNIEEITAGFTELIDNQVLANKLTKNASNWLRENLDFQSLSVKLGNFIKSE